MLRVLECCFVLQGMEDMIAWGSQHQVCHQRPGNRVCLDSQCTRTTRTASFDH